MGAFTLAGLLYLGAPLPSSRLSVAPRRHTLAVRASLPNLSLAVVLGGAVGPVLLAVGLGLVPAATVVAAAQPRAVFTTVVARLVFHEHLGRNVITGTALIIVGSVVLTLVRRPRPAVGGPADRRRLLAVGRSTTAPPPRSTRLNPSHITLAKGLDRRRHQPDHRACHSQTRRRSGRSCGRWSSAASATALSITLGWPGTRPRRGPPPAGLRHRPVHRGASSPGPCSANRSPPAELLAFGIAASRGRVRTLEPPRTRPHPRATGTHPRPRPRRSTTTTHPDGLVTSGRHTHPHVHAAIAHQHPHLPDLHHRHDH